MSSELTIEQYSEKAIAVRGNTQPFKEHLKDFGGKWNSGLRGGGGWIFPNSKKPKIEELNQLISKGEVKASPVEKKTYTSSSSSSSSSSSLPVTDRNFVPLKDYLDLLSRVERLEQIVSHVDFVKSSVPSTKTTTTKPSSKKEEAEIEIAEDSDEDEEEAPQKVERLMKRGVSKK